MKRLLFILITAGIMNSLFAQNIGIGTTSPNGKALLDVVSTNKGILIPRMTSLQRVAIAPTSLEAGLLVYETNTSSFWYFNGSVWNQIGTGGVSPWTVSSTTIYNSNTGNVGIGTSTNINEKLTVKGDALLVYPGSTSVILSLMGNTNNQGRINFIRPDSTVLGSVYGWDLTDNLYLQAASNTNQLVLDVNGRIGIKTSAPTKILDVVGSIRSRDTISADDDLEAGNNIRAGGRVDATGVIEGGGLSSTGTLYVNGTSLLGGSLTASSDATVYGTITTNTGININDAAGTLNFQTAGNDKGFVQLSGDNLRVGTYSSNTTGKFVIRTGGGDQVQVNNSGNVGIGLGAAAPSAKLHVAGKIFANTNGEAIRIDGTTPSIGFYHNGGVTSTSYSFITQNATELYIGVNGRLHLDATTSVSIGAVDTDGDSYKLAVNGRIVCEELKVKLSQNWPDYVFHEDYKLMPLSEVQKFINTNKHLPNIPSAATVEKEGIFVGDMQKKLMEKVEELTLYILDLQKQVDELKKGTK